MFFRYLKHSTLGYCPNCGVGELFVSWSRMKDKCSDCGVWFIEKQGDYWFFLLFIDRGLFIFPIIVGYYFGLSPERLIALSLFLLVLFIIVTPFRLGLSLAFDYFMRTKMLKEQ